MKKGVVFDIFEGAMTNAPEDNFHIIFRVLKLFYYQLNQMCKKWLFICKLSLILNSDILCDQN